MLTTDAFEELLASYPSDKRELARRVYQRFAEGDSTEFFTQLFLVLDIYAHYAERVPQAVIQANQSAQVQFTRLRDEIGLLAQTIDKRNLSISNEAERIEELCAGTGAKTVEVITRFDSLLKNIGTQIDTKAIISGIRTEIENGIRREIIAPFITKTNELAKEAIPTLKELRDAAGEARKLWPKHIWQTVWFSGMVVIVAATTLIGFALEARFKSKFENIVAPKIVAAERSIEKNREAFHELAIAGVTLHMVQVQNRQGVPIPSAFALVFEKADSAETRLSGDRKDGVLFFTSERAQKQIGELRQIMEKSWPTSER